MTTENMIRKLMDDYNVAGMSVALIRGGNIVSAEGYGLRDAAAQLPMTADTVLPIGSITKTFTALALGMLVDEGKLDWDVPVKTYIPSLKLSSALLTENVTARDLMLTIIGRISANGANYMAMEFGGAGLHSLTMSDRFSICNLAVEAGAKTALMEVDDATMAFLEEHGGRAPKACFAPDEDAEYAKVYDIDLDEIVPVVAKPHFVDNVCPVSELEEEVKINEAFLGSCNNGRLQELRLGAEIIKGKKVAPGVRFLVVPASRDVYRDALEEGILDTFMEAGAIVMNPNCSVCWGSCQGVIGEGEVLVSTGTRNFKGRAGHKDSFVYLASAATVTASAIAGKIVTADEL